MSNSTKTLIDDQEGLDMKKIIENFKDCESDAYKRITQIDLLNDDFETETCEEPTDNDLVKKLKVFYFTKVAFKNLSHLI